MKTVTKTEMKSLGLDLTELKETKRHLEITNLKRQEDCH